MMTFKRILLLFFFFVLHFLPHVEFYGLNAESAAGRFSNSDKICFYVGQIGAEEPLKSVVEERGGGRGVG